MRNHVAITGTGRSGTSFLVQLLTRLGLDTGFSVEDLDRALDPIGRAGLELDIRKEDAPYVVKSPNMANYIHEVLEHKDITLDLVIIPIRDIDEATASRVRVSDENLKALSWWRRLFRSKRGFAGGMTWTSKPHKQPLILLRSLSHLLVECAKHDQPLVLLHYPRLLEDPAYLFRKLQPILDGVSLSAFEKVHAETLRPAHSGADQVS